MQSGKRQRRQSAALVVQSLWSSNAATTTKKKPAAPGDSKPNRPVLEIPPMGIGPIREPNANDVLCGRGGLINGSVGNVQFRNIVSKKKKEYNAKSTKRHEKAHLAAEIVRQIRSMNPPGRFLREDANGIWWDIGDARAIRKTGQALREAAPTIRQELEGGDKVNGDGDRLSDADSDDDSEKGGEAPAVEDAKKKDESPKHKIMQEPSLESHKKEDKTIKETVKKSNKQPATHEAVTAASPTPSSVSSKTTRSSWIPGRNSRSNDSAAEPSRASQSFLIPTAALGPHITGSMTSVAPQGMPRMSGGAVFSNVSHRSRGFVTPTPPIVGSEYPYPHPYPAHYQYPYSQPHGHPQMHPPHYPPHHLHPPHHPHMAPPPHPMVHPHPSSAYQYPYPVGYSEDAFGMAFYPTSDLTTAQSEGSCNVSDISGLSSSVTGDQRKQKEMYYKMKYPQSNSSGMEGGRPSHPPMSSLHVSNNMYTAPEPMPEGMYVAPVPMSEGMDYGSGPMMDTSSSLPSFSDILDDVDMASATSGKGSSLSITSSSVAKLLAPAPTSNYSNNMKPPPSQSFSKNHSKLSTIAPMALHNAPMKENTSSCLSGKSGSCVSGKSEISLPSSCGTNISTFSDTFMAMNLSEYD